MTMYDNLLLKSYMRNHEYSKCIDLLKKKIVTNILKQIKLKDNTVNYTTISDLVNLSDTYLDNSKIARYLQIALRQETELEKMHYLLSLCEEFNIT